MIVKDAIKTLQEIAANGGAELELFGVDGTNSFSAISMMVNEIEDEISYSGDLVYMDKGFEYVEIGLD